MILEIFGLKTDFRVYFLLITASVQLLQPGPTLVPGVLQGVYLLVNVINIHILQSRQLTLSDTPAHSLDYQTRCVRVRVLEQNIKAV